jgi:hypothetical protein
MTGRLHGWSALLATYAAVGGLWLLLGRDPGPSPEVDEVRCKGAAASLMVFRQVPGGAERVAEGTPVRPGDRLQLAYRPAPCRTRFGVVASVDSRDHVTLHLPDHPGRAPRLSPRNLTALPSAFELDDDAGFERFVLVTAETPFSTAAVVQYLRGAGRKLPPGLQATEVTLPK